VLIKFAGDSLVWLHQADENAVKGIMRTVAPACLTWN